jgi:N-acetylglucosamine-6-sulfatase
MTLVSVLCLYLWGASATRMASANGANPRPDPKPNIVVILTDDLSMNLLPYMPNVAAMQKEGTTFSNYFVTDSLCCPSRSSIFTGEFPHNTGVYENNGRDGGYRAFNANGNQEHTFAVALQRAGYRTALLGKYLNGYRPKFQDLPPGWTEWDVAGDGYREFHYRLNQNGKSVRYGMSEDDYLTDVVSRLGRDFIRKSGKEPFFIEIATFAPHTPFIPAPRDADKLPGLKAPRTQAYGARPDEAAPAWLKGIPPLEGPDHEEIDKFFRKRAQSVLAVDQMIGDIRAMLVAAGEDDNTYVVFSSDNGLHLGEYSLRAGKMTPFDTDTHVPLVVVGPGVRRGVVVNEMVENIDLSPTFTEIGGASAGTTPDGHSLVSLLRGTATDWRRMVLVEHRSKGKALVDDPDEPDDPDAQDSNSGGLPTYNALRTKEALYVEYETREKTYYDLPEDPEELRNVIAKLPVENRQRWHKMLLDNVACKGTAACWAAQNMRP